MNIIILPLVGALIGWVTNFIAVKMLFRPSKEISFLGIKIQGVFPKRQKELAIKVSEIVANELIGTEKINSLKNNLSKDKISEKIDYAIDGFVKNRIVQVFPMAAMFLNDEIVNKIKSFFIADLNLTIDSVLSENSEAISSLVNIKDTIKDKIEGFSPLKLEKLILEVMKKELVFVEYVGGILGFIIGLLQILIIG